MYLHTMIICCLSVSVFFSCSSKKSYSKTNLELKSTNAEVEKEWVDPLFFIEGQLCQHVRKIYEDSKGNLWFGTNVYGLMKYDGDTLHHYEDEDGIKGRITGILEDKKGTLWIGTSFGLVYYKGEGFMQLTEEDGLQNNEIWSLYLDGDDLLWIGTNEGLCTYDGEKFNSISFPKAQVKDTNTVYSYDRVISIVGSKDGRIWIGTDGFGITIMNQNKEETDFSFFTTENGLPDNVISELFFDTNENLWIGTYYGGVSEYDGIEFKNYTKEGFVKGVEVSGLYEDRDNNIWFSVENQGIYQFDGNAFTTYGQNDGLESLGILSIYEDCQNRFWLGGWGGLFRHKNGTFLPVSKMGPWD